MPFCPKCGAQADSGASFCSKCGTSLKNITSETSIRLSTKEKGGVLEDSVASYFRRMGFDVEPRVRLRDRFDVSHEIDVLASKKEAFGTIRVAVECKYVKMPMDIKEVRNFHDKLSALGITKGIFVSTGGFTADAESHAKALGIELWDMKTLQGKVAEEEIPQKDVIHDALPVKLVATSALSPKHLRNFNVLTETIQLVYRPYYFMDYHCFSQHTVAGNSAILESKGGVVLDGVTGQVVDCTTSAGQEPSMVRNGAFIGCSQIPPQTVTIGSLPALPLSVIPHKVDTLSASNLAKIELVKGLSLEYKYVTTTTIGRKLLKPRKKDIDLLNVQGPVKIPILLGTYRFRNHSYVRQCVASTGVLALDQTAYCLLCRNPATFVCENCGGISCASQSKNCIVCEKNLCESCAIRKGVISKKYYCPHHRPA